jgi:hypothetical protein
MGILLTFGVVFPPLVVVMCATMLSVAWQTKLSLSRGRLPPRGAPHLTEGEFQEIVLLSMTWRGLVVIMCFACCFYALFLFATLGDAVGLSGAYWVLIVIPLLPIVLYAVLRIRHRVRTEDSRAPVSPPGKDARSVELQSRPMQDRALADMEQPSAGNDVTYNTLIKS